jgi:hypothetical protein
MQKWALVFILFILCSCEKTIDIKPEIREPLVVVDAQIENGQPPIVTLTNSINYFSTISREILSGIFIRDAQVTINDGTKTYKLKEYTVPIGGGFNTYYYSVDNANSAAIILGQFGKSYTLQVVVNGKSYTSQTNIPNLTKKIDTLWWKAAPFNEDTTKVNLLAKVTDPPGYGNYIRYFTKVNRGVFLPGANSAFDDQIIDGKTYEVQVDKGIDRNNPPEQEDYGFFKRGDTATVKFCNTDKATYDFWRTIEFGYQSVGNPFSSPIKILGNVSNGALGAFCGYAAQYKTIIIPK